MHLSALTESSWFCTFAMQTHPPLVPWRHSMEVVISVVFFLCRRTTSSLRADVRITGNPLHAPGENCSEVSQHSFQNESIFRLLLKVAVMRVHQCDYIIIFFRSPRSNSSRVRFRKTQAVDFVVFLSNLCSQKKAVLWNSVKFAVSVQIAGLQVSLRKGQ